MASRRSTRNTDSPWLLRCTSASGVVRASRIIRSECCTREIQTFCPLTTQRSPRRTAVVLILVVSVPVVGSVTPMLCRRNSPRAIGGSQRAFCCAEPWRSSVPMLYICPWQAPALPPQRLISSMMTLASARPRPDPPYSCGMSAASQPAWVRASTNSTG